MTSNQIAYWQLQETKRSNIVRETETQRSNLAKETETNRSNLAKEAETHRSNVMNEWLTSEKISADRTIGMINSISNAVKTVFGGLGTFIPS